MRAVVMLAKHAGHSVDRFRLKEDVVIKTIERESTDSWIRRARAAGTHDAAFGAEPNTAAEALAVRSRDSWDPWEVWLLHIDQPRRRLAARDDKATG